MRIDGMRGVFVTAVLTGLGTADAFSSSLAAPSLLRGAPAARAALRGPASAFGARSLRAQMRPEDKQGKRAEADAGAAWQEFVRSAREGWQGAAADRSAASSSLPSVFLVPVWLGVAGIGNDPWPPASAPMRPGRSAIRAAV